MGDLYFAGAGAGIYEPRQVFGILSLMFEIFLHTAKSLTMPRSFGASEYCQIGWEQHEKQATQDSALMYYMSCLSWTLW